MGLAFSDPRSAAGLVGIGAPRSVIFVRSVTRDRSFTILKLALTTLPVTPGPSHGPRGSCHRGAGRRPRPLAVHSLSRCGPLNPGATLSPTALSLPCSTSAHILLAGEGGSHRIRSWALRVRARTVGTHHSAPTPALAFLGGSRRGKQGSAKRLSGSPTSAFFAIVAPTRFFRFANDATSVFTKSHFRLRRAASRALVLTWMLSLNTWWSTLAFSRTCSNFFQLASYRFRDRSQRWQSLKSSLGTPASPHPALPYCRRYMCSVTVLLAMSSILAWLQFRGPRPMNWMKSWYSTIGSMRWRCWMWFMSTPLKFSPVARMTLIRNPSQYVRLLTASLTSSILRSLPAVLYLYPPALPTASRVE